MERNQAIALLNQYDLKIGDSVQLPIKDSCTGKTIKIEGEIALVNLTLYLIINNESFSARTPLDNSNLSRLEKV